MIAGSARYVLIAIGVLACATPSPAARVTTPGDASTASTVTTTTTTTTAPSVAPASVELAGAEPAAAARTLPNACGEGPICTPPADFAAKMCGGLYPEVALHLFAPGTPWKRAYVQRAFQAWHVGGHGDMRELRLNEEVLIIATGRGGPGIQGLGGQAFDVLRWDGTCVSLMEDEISFKKPGGAVPANIAWKKLEPAYQALLAEDKGIVSLRATQTRLCESKSAEQEPGKSKCEIARRQTSLAIAQLVGKGKPLPELSSIP